MTDVIDEARRLKAEAMDLRDLGDLDGAVQVLRAGEHLLRSTLDELRSKRGKEPPGRQEIDVANQLVHILGSIGGTLRRKGNYAAAAAAYDDGRVLEAPEAGYGIVNSYNLVQALVSRVFLDPGAAEDGAPMVAERNVRRELEAAREEIFRQLRGARSDDEYAAADLATVLLLLDDPGWELALDDFVASRPEPYAVDVTRDLFDALHARVESESDASGGLAGRLSAAIHSLGCAS